MSAQIVEAARRSVLITIVQFLQRIVLLSTQATLTRVSLG